MRIRTARVTDAGELSELLGQLGYPTTAAEAGQRVSALLGDAESTVLVATDADDHPIGCLHACVRRHLAGPPFVQVTSLVVRSDQRGRGIGAELLTHAEEWAAERGLAVVRLRCNVTRLDAHRFYARAGYTLAKTSHLFVKRLAGG